MGYNTNQMDSNTSLPFIYKPPQDTAYHESVLDSPPSLYSLTQSHLWARRQLYCLKCHLEDARACEYSEEISGLQDGRKYTLLEMGSRKKIENGGLVSWVCKVRG